MAAKLTGFVPRLDLVALAAGTLFYGVAIAALSYAASPALAIGLSAAVGVAIAAFANPLATLYLGIASIPLESLQFAIGPFGLSPPEAIFALTGLGWASTRLMRGLPPWTPSPLGKPLGLLLLAIVPGLAVATDTIAVVKTLGFWILFFFLYQLVVADGRRETVRNLLAALALAGLGVGIVAIVQSGGHPQELVGFGDVATGRAEGPFGHPNSLASFEALALPAALALALTGRAVQRPLGAGAFVAIFVAIVLSLSRGGFLAVAGALAIMLIWQPFRRAALVAAVIVGVFAVIAPPQLGDVQETDLVTKRLSSLGHSASGVDPRFQVWGAAVRIIRDHPGIGIGQNQFSNVAPDYGLVNLNASGTFEHAHNIVLTTFAELGLPGVIAYFWLGIALARVLIQAVRGSPRRYRGLAVAVAAGFVAFVLQGMVDYTLRSGVIVASLTVLAGCAVVLARAPRDAQPATSVR
jgi:O-antigen ligase